MKFLLLAKGPRMGDFWNLEADYPSSTIFENFFHFLILISSKEKIL